MGTHWDPSKYTTDSPGTDITNVILNTLTHLQVTDVVYILWWNSDEESGAI